MANRGFWRELMRRNVVRAAIVYVAAVWALAQGVAQLVPYFGAPPWIVRWFVIACAIGFPFWLAFAWFYELTPEGLKRESEVDRSRSTARSTGRKLDYWIIGILAVAVVLLVTNEFVLRRDVTSRAEATSAKAIAAALAKVPAKSVAVLPFENLSADKNNEYFVAGMQDLILTKLADIGDLKVIARTATESYPSHPENLGAIAAKLDVATFLEGSVQKAGRQVLINVQLIDAKTDAHIWAESYTRTLDNIFGVEGEVADKVAKALNAKLTASETAAVARVPTTNPQAYDNYLRALHFENEAAKGDWATFLPQAITAAEKAVAEDPDFALAWAELAGARLDNTYWAGDRSKANLRAAEVAAKRALALDPKLPEAHLVMGFVERLVYHDLVATHDQDQQAVDLRPNDPGALDALAISDGNLGHPDAAIKAFRRAVALDPTGGFKEFQLGLELASVGDYAAARQAQRRALAIDPQNVQAYLALSGIDIAQNGDVAAATKVLDQMAPGTPVNARVVTTRINLLLYQRQFDAARALAGKYAGKFTTGRPAIEMALARADIEWLAGNTDRAHARYRAAIGLITRSGTTSDHEELGLAYARLGETDAAMKENAAAAAGFRGPHNPVWLRASQYILAKAQLALGRKSAAIDTLAQFAAPGTHGARIVSRFPPELLRIDPVWDPIRHDPRFQALLKQYAKALPAAATSAGKAVSE